MVHYIHLVVGILCLTACESTRTGVAIDKLRPDTIGDETTTGPSSTVTFGPFNMTTMATPLQLMTAETQDGGATYAMDYVASDAAQNQITVGVLLQTTSEQPTVTIGKSSEVALTVASVQWQATSGQIRVTQAGGKGALELKDVLLSSGSDRMGPLEGRVDGRIEAKCVYMGQNDPGGPVSSTGAAPSRYPRVDPDWSSPFCQAHRP